MVRTGRLRRFHTASAGTAVRTFGLLDGESDSVSQTLIAAVPACQARKQGK